VNDDNSTWFAITLHSCLEKNRRREKGGSSFLISPVVSSTSTQFDSERRSIVIG
jgi:hypothetical protein